MRSLFRSGRHGLPSNLVSPSCMTPKLFSDVAREKVEKVNQYNRDRAKWREQVSVLRKQYAQEDSMRKEEERKRREALATDIAIRKAENMRKKLIRSAETAKRVAIERVAATAKFEAHIVAMDQVRAARKNDNDARLRAMVTYLEEESKKWFSPERIDIEIDEKFINEPGILGHCAERSPYWGFVPEVEDIKELIAQVRNGVVPDLAEEKPEPMELVNDFMLSASRNYLEYKRIRESEGDLEGVLKFFEEQEYDGPSNEYRGQGDDDDEYDDENVDGDDDGERNRSLGGGLIGRFAKPSGAQLFDQDEQKIASQLARLRARRLRPMPVPPTE